MMWDKWISLLAFLIIVFIAILNIISSVKHITGKKPLYCKIRDTIHYSRLPIIMLETSSKRRLNFVLDTGATQSYIRRTTVEECRFPVDNNRKTRTYSVDTESVQTGSVILSLTNNGYLFEERFVVNDMERTLMRVEEDSGYHVDGLLGMSFMLRYIVSIDFKRRRIYFSKLEKETNKTKKYAGKDDLYLQSIGDKREVRKCDSRVGNGGTRKDKGDVSIHKARPKESGCSRGNI